MSVRKQHKMAEKRAAEQQRVILELNALVKSIERCVTTITELKSELETVNAAHQGARTTRQEIDYLTELLKCAHKKLAWEKQLASLQKRTPELLEQMGRLLNDPAAPPDDPFRGEMLRALQGVQAAMERLHGVEVN
jgi:hypothetical protein